MYVIILLQENILEYFGLGFLANLPFGSGVYDLSRVYNTELLLVIQCWPSLKTLAHRFSHTGLVEACELKLAGNNLLTSWERDLVLLERNKS